MYLLLAMAGTRYLHRSAVKHIFFWLLLLYLLYRRNGNYGRGIIIRVQRSDEDEMWSAVQFEQPSFFFVSTPLYLTFFL
jgi:hypothetical protein